MRRRADLLRTGLLTTGVLVMSSVGGAVRPARSASPDPGSGSPPGQAGRTGGDAEPAPLYPTPTTPAAPMTPASRSTTTTTTARADVRMPDPVHRLAVLPRFAYRFGSPGVAVTPSAGFGIGGTFEVTYARLTADLEGSLGIDFSHDRFSRSEVGAVSTENMTETFRSPRVTSETSFVVVHTAAARINRLRAYLTLGAGLGLGYFDSAALELRPGTARDTHALGRVSVGVDVNLTRDLKACLRADYTALRGVSVVVTERGERLALFGDLFGLGAGLAYRF